MPGTFAFRRAANILAEEDRIVFEGFGRGFPNDTSPIVVSKVEQQGLANLRRDRNSLVWEFHRLTGQAVVRPGGTQCISWKTTHTLLPSLAC